MRRDVVRRAVRALLDGGQVRGEGRDAQVSTRSMFYKGQAKRDSQVRDQSFLPKSCQYCILKNKGQN